MTPGTGRAVGVTFLWLGATLGTGNADFDAVFPALGRVGYSGNYILQTARAADGDHASALSRYRDMAVDWLVRYAP